MELLQGFFSIGLTPKMLRAPCQNDSLKLASSTHTGGGAKVRRIYASNLLQYQKPADLMGHQLVSVAHSRRPKIQLLCVHKQRKDNAMATLTSLKLVAVKRTATQNPIVHRRQKLCTKIAEQINLAKALKNGETYAPTRLKTVTNAAGERVQVNHIKRMKPWWFTEGGKVYLQIRYGAKQIQLSPKANVIDVGSTDALVGILEAVHAATLAGELDTQIEALSGQIRNGFGK